MLLPSLVRPAVEEVPAAEDRNYQTYALLGDPACGSPPTTSSHPCAEVGIVALIPVVIWCLVSWALSYASETHILNKVQLFGFLPAAAVVFACERMRRLRTLPAQLTVLQEENEWFKSHNVELKRGVELLKSENEEAQLSNRRLQESISGLESVRAAIELHASRTEADFGDVLAEFQKGVAEQKQILLATRRIQKRTRKFAEAQWRSVMLNMYFQVEYTDGERGMTREEFGLWLTMLPCEISEKLSPETFDSIDVNGDGIIDIKEMCEWVQSATSTLLNLQGDAEDEDDTADDTHAEEPIDTDGIELLGTGTGLSGACAPARGSAACSKDERPLGLEGLTPKPCLPAPSQSAPPGSLSVRRNKLHQEPPPGPRPPSFDDSKLRLLFGAPAANAAALGWGSQDAGQEPPPGPRPPSFDDSKLRLLFGAPAANTAAAPGRSAGLPPAPAQPAVARSRSYPPPAGRQ